MNKKIIISIVLVVIVIAAIWYLAGKGEKEPIKIGAILPFSGKYSHYGERAKKALELALEDLDVQVIYEDSKMEPKEAVSAFLKMNNLEDIKIFITLSSSISMALAPLANENKVIQMAITASTPEYTSLGDFTFRTTPRAEAEDKELAKAITSQYEKVALFYSNEERGLGHKETIKEEIEKLGGKVIAEESYMLEDMDFKTQLFKIKEKEPQALFLLGDAKTLGAILKQIGELGIEVQVFATRSAEDEQVLEIAGEAAQGVIYTVSFDPNSNNPLVEEFTRRYGEKYGETPDYIAAEAYEALILLSRAVEECKEDTSCIKDYLFGLKDYQGLMGNLTFDENGDVYFPYFLKTIKDGEFVPYGVK